MNSANKHQLSFLQSFFAVVLEAWRWLLSQFSGIFSNVIIPPDVMKIQPTSS